MTTDRINDVPYFYARNIGGSVEVEGESNCLMGHKLDQSQNGKTIPDGIFAEWHWNGETLTITNDRYGFYPLYYYCDEDSFAVSSSMLRILPFCRNRELNGPALGVYYRTGSFIDNDTHFKHIHALGPSATLKWSREGLSITGEELWFRKAKNISKKEAAAQFNELLAQAIKRRHPGEEDFIIPLSGGRDSRHILLELMKQDIRPQACVTFHDYPDWRGQDMPVTEALVKELGVEHIVLDQDPNRFDVESRKNLMTDLCSSRSIKMIVLADYLNESVNTTYDGIAGMLSQSFLMDPNQMNQYKEDAFDQLTKELLAQWSMGEDAFDLVLSKQMKELLNYDDAFAYLKKEVMRHQEAANPIGSYYFWNRTRRDITLSPYAMMWKVSNVYSPYLDHDLNDFLFTLPAEIVRSDALHDEAIRTGYPQYAHIPFEDKGAANPAADEHWSQIIKDFSKYYFKHKCFLSKYFNTAYMTPRMLRCLFDNRYRIKSRWMPFMRLLNMHQLEEHAII